MHDNLVDVISMQRVQHPKYCNIQLIQQRKTDTGVIEIFIGALILIVSMVTYRARHCSVKFQVFVERIEVASLLLTYSKNQLERHHYFTESILGLHVTSRPPCWWSITKHFHQLLLFAPPTWPLCPLLNPQGLVATHRLEILSEVRLH